MNPINNRIFDLKNTECSQFVFNSNKASFVNDFRDAFDFIRVYHASNLSEEEMVSIRQEGLLLSTPELMKQKAIARFIKESDNKDIQEAILRTIQDAFEGDSTVKEINFSHLKEELLSDSYHYLLLGPETLLPLAGVLKHKFDLNFRSRMIQFGLHCIISANVPVAKTDDDWIEIIFEYIHEGFPECCLVYYHDLEPINIAEIEKHERPCDKQYFEGM